MDTKEIASLRAACAQNCIGRLFFLLAVIGFSLNPVGTPSAVPFKVELHEEVAPRVSRRTWSLGKTLRQRCFHQIRNYVQILVTHYLRIHHLFRIFRDFHTNLPNQMRQNTHLYSGSDDMIPSSFMG